MRYFCQPGTIAAIGASGMPVQRMRDRQAPSNPDRPVRTVLHKPSATLFCLQEPVVETMKQPACKNVETIPAHCACPYCVRPAPNAQKHNNVTPSRDTSTTQSMGGVGGALHTFHRGQLPKYPKHSRPMAAQRQTHTSIHSFDV